ncbi:hypothetical protein EZS27_010767 [termite gut metagenome]|uniref:DUF4836 family protein n=1 Tax=termite gut metagenome TaxID=433724 RepID=A0A5J4S6H0_9ZZZZ
MNRKILYKYLLPVALIAFFMASCSGESASTAYTNVIPADIPIVLSFDAKAMLDKAGLGEKESTAIKQKLVNIIKDEVSAESFTLFEKIIKNPAESGIDMTAPLYVFFDSIEGTPAIVAKIGNQSKWTALLITMASEDLVAPAEEHNGYHSVKLSNSEVTCAFNKTSILIINDNNYFSFFTDSLMLQKEENSLSASAAFRDMLKKKGEIKCMAFLKEFPGNTVENGLEDVVIISNLSFENGRISLQAESYMNNKELKALFEQQRKIFQPQDLAFVSKYPISTLAYIGLNLNGEKLCNFIRENNEMYKPYFPHTWWKPEVWETVEEFLYCFDGDLSVGLLDTSLSSVSFAAYAKVKDDAAAKALYHIADKYGITNGITQINPDKYVGQFWGDKIYFGVKNKQLYVTNDERTADNITQSLNGKTLQDAEFAPNMKTVSPYAVVSVENILDLPVMKLFDLKGGGAYSAYMNFVSRISYLEITGDGTAGEVNLCFKDKKTNALKQVTDVARQYSGM